ncbi:MAG: hypothetical protein RIT28_363 [Pseudomonadota bacterium]|jgi:ankyrin repeat protein
MSTMDPPNDTPLHQACELGHTRSIEQLLTRSVDLEAEGEDGLTALTLAALYGHHDACALLLAAGADPAHYDDHGNTALHLGAMRGHGEVIQLLLDHAPQTALMFNRQGLRPVVLAAIEGQAECVKTFIQRLGPEQTDEALHQAAAFGHAGVVGLLLALGVPVNLLDRSGRAALHWAVQEARLEVIDLLFSASADPNIVAVAPEGLYDHTILGLAAAEGRVDVISKLLAGGAKIDMTDRDGRTALHFAAIFNRREVVAALLAAGASPAALDKRGLRPLDHARRRRRVRVIRLLEAAEGAKTP